MKIEKTKQAIMDYIHENTNELSNSELVYLYTAIISDLEIEIEALGEEFLKQ